MKKIPIGVDDFKKIRVKDYFYIDKTKFIEEIFNDGAEVKLFTRPRRFGKTLNMSMLKYFFDVKEAQENRKLFDDLYIKNSPVFAEQGKYPVIFISMKGITDSNFEEALSKIREKISNLYEEYTDIFDKLDEFTALKFKNYVIGNIDKAQLENSLLFLTKLLYKHYKQKVILLIDEYDSPIMTAYEKGYYTEMKDFIKAFYGDVLKSNENLQMGVLTGAIRVAQAGIFSDLNNLKVNTILNKAYEECFGLSQPEVESALKYYNLDYKIEEVKSWYNGYKFGNAEVYNPWSILNYIDEKELKAYWINTSGNMLIKELLLLSKNSVFETLDNLVNGQEKTVYINESIALGNNLDPNSIWELMLFSGYLTVKNKINNEAYSVVIPNKEIQSFFKKLFVEIVFKNLNNTASMKEALQSKNIGLVVKILEEVVLNAMSFYDTSRKYENPYQTLLAGFLYGLDDYYKIMPNIETGYGRADIILKPRNIDWAGYIFELKRAKTENLEEEAKQAFNQIEDKKYDTILRSEGVKEIIKIGLVFDGKRVEANY